MCFETESNSHNLQSPTTAGLLISCNCPSSFSFINHRWNSTMRARLQEQGPAALSFPAHGNLCWVSITCADPVIICKANNNPASFYLTQDSCVSNHHISRLPPPLGGGRGKNYTSVTGGSGGCHSCFFRAVTLWLNSVSNGSINKVFRRSAVCSPFPSLSEWLSVSVPSAARTAQENKTVSKTTLMINVLYNSCVH